MFIFSQVDLSAETRAQTPNTRHTTWIFRHTHTHTLKHSERSEGTTAFNPLCAAISPKYDSSPLFLFIFNFFFFFYSPLHSHCDSKGRAYLKLTPAPWYPLRAPTRYYSVPGMGSATWRTSRMSGMEMLNRKRLSCFYSCINSFKAAQVFLFLPFISITALLFGTREVFIRWDVEDGESRGLKMFGVYF